MSSNDSPAFSTFLQKIPLELRLMIYVYLLGQTHEAQPTAPYPLTLEIPKISLSVKYGGYVPGIKINTKSRSLHPEILRTCKQIHIEAEATLYRESAMQLVENSPFDGYNLHIQPVPQLNFITSLYLCLNPHSFSAPLAILLAQLPCLHTVRGISTWPTPCYDYIANAFSEPQENNLCAIQEINKNSHIKNFTCTFQLSFANGAGLQPGSAFELAWKEFQRENPNVRFSALNSEILQQQSHGFRFHRWWMEQIQRELQKQGFLVGVPLAWQFRTKTTQFGTKIQGYAEPCLEMKVDMPQSQILCEVIRDYGQMSCLEEL
ncbi:hypothetical protein BT63DRAFT_415414 [Microthyrium microscopicum]|uniref:F-box domain-containing protein n=1 Tax=Microthyrium microscopicum TaxID=703497 RepID=A0A6A6U8B3_9PEZI|nr:hypothetical protein BT63DRAFT_415414 [Microthyrium microscopicum]